ASPCRSPARKRPAPCRRSHDADARRCALLSRARHGLAGDPAAMSHSSATEVARQRAGLVIEIALAFAVSVMLWLAIYFLLPPLAGMEAPLARLVFALKCGCVAILFAFVLGIEAVAH